MHGSWQVELMELTDGPAGCGEVVSGGCCLAFQRDQVNCTYGGREKDQTKHDAVAALVTRC